MNPGRTIVIGGGAAGMMAAGRAAQRGADVVLLEKMGQIGRKIGISGKGRCNLTNSCSLEDFLRRFGKNGRFLRQCFHTFFNAELMEFMRTLNVPVQTERGGRVFPQSGQALDVVRALYGWLMAEGVEIRKNHGADEIVTAKGAIHGVMCGGRTLPCDNVILATGGKSYPRTGSTGDGYRLAVSLGHTVTPLRPALVPLTCNDSRIHQLAGLELRNVMVRVLQNNTRVAQEFGEVSFTDFGLGGPVILTLSSMIVDALLRGDNIALLLDLKPALNTQKLDARLIRDLEARGGEPLANLLRGLLPQQLIPLCLEENGLDRNLDTRRFPAKLRKRLGHWLKNMRIEISGFRPIEEAIVTAGGISLAEVDPKTMASKKIPGLYIVGELLDLHADTGGYNLQAAFSTGWLAGNSVGCPGIRTASN